ncbi:MAG TPA: thioredoxin family protein [Acidimicrobiia bacterium]|jgi:thiol-disulfide isomerase/thioredoxin
MTGRLVLLAFLTAGIATAWWALTAGHRRLLRRRISGEPRTAILFTASDCAACRAQERIVASLEPTVGQRIRSVDVGRHPDVSARYGVFTVPTTVFFDGDGAVAGIQFGVTDAAVLKRALDVA